MGWIIGALCAAALGSSVAGPGADGFHRSKFWPSQREAKLGFVGVTERIIIPNNDAGKDARVPVSNSVVVSLLQRRFFCVIDQKSLNLNIFSRMNDELWSVLGREFLLLAFPQPPIGSHQDLRDRRRLEHRCLSIISHREYHADRLADDYLAFRQMGFHVGTQFALRVLTRVEHSHERSCDRGNQQANLNNPKPPQLLVHAVGVFGGEGRAPLRVKVSAVARALFALLGVLSSAGGGLSLYLAFAHSRASLSRFIVGSCCIFGGIACLLIGAGFLGTT